MSHGPCDPSTLADAHHCRPREHLARMSIDRARVARGEAGDDDPRRARAGDDGSAPRDRRVSSSAGDVELREIVVERAILNPGETRDDASSPSSSEDDDTSSAPSQQTRGGPPDGGEEDDGDEHQETPGPMRGEKKPGTRVVRVVGVERESDGKTEDEDEDDDVDFCRICMDPIRREDLVSFSRADTADAAETPIQRDGVRVSGATHLGCACTGGYMHVSCASQYVAKRAERADLTCEICLETMENLRSLRDRRVEARRRASRARLAFLALNGASAEDIRRERRRIERRRRGGDDDDDDAFRRRVGDARADAFGWGSRNPCVWVLWILTRPLIVAAWVRVTETPVSFCFFRFFRTETPVSIDFIPNECRRVSPPRRVAFRVAFRFSRLDHLRREFSFVADDAKTATTKDDALINDPLIASRQKKKKAFDLASRFVSSHFVMLFVLAFWGLLLYSWYRSF